jgi:phosphoglycolate phosphatase
MRPYDLLVFDWDGTLVDSIGSIVGCTERALADVGAAPAGEAAIRRTIGLGIRDMIEALVPGCDDALFLAICEAYRGHWLADFGSRHQPFAGVDTLLGELAAEGYLLAVATAKSRRGLMRDLERTGLGRHFLASRTVDEAPPKPHPGMLEGLVDELGVRSERTLMIGDTAHDLQMAANAGTEAVAVLGGSQERDELAAAPHLAILAGAFELPGWLAGTVNLANRP